MSQVWQRPTQAWTAREAASTSRVATDMPWRAGFEQMAFARDAVAVELLHEQQAVLYRHDIVSYRVPQKRRRRLLRDVLLETPVLLRFADARLTFTMLLRCAYCPAVMTG